MKINLVLVATLDIVIYLYQHLPVRVLFDKGWCFSAPGIPSRYPDVFVSKWTGFNKWLVGGLGPGVVWGSNRATPK